MKFLDRFITDKDIRAIKFIPSVPERLVYLGIELDRDGIGFNCQNLFSIWDSFFFSSTPIYFKFNLGKKRENWLILNSIY